MEKKEVSCRAVLSRCTPHHYATVQVRILLEFDSRRSGILLSRRVAVKVLNKCFCVFAVGKNPDPICNPFLGEDDVLGVVIGVTITVVSLGYAGWSSTADKTLGGSGYVH